MACKKVGADITIRDDDKSMFPLPLEITLVTMDYGSPRYNADVYIFQKSPDRPVPWCYITPGKTARDIP